MKPFVAISVILALFALAFPIALSVGNPLSADGTNGTEDVAVTASPSPSPPATTAPVSSSPSATATATAQTPVDAGITIRVLVGGTVTEMSMADYLVGVVAAEMPVSFEPEALKAQAVAARTYLLYKMLVSPSSSHPQADVCDDYTCCSAYSGTDKLKDKWGDSYDENIAKITSAVKAVDGLYLSYNSSPILAVFHSSSNGKTESSLDVWGTDLAYLQSVDSCENSSEIKNYVTVVTISPTDFKNTVSAAYPDADFSGDVSAWITNITYTTAGRLDTASIGGITIAGTELRSLFELRSADIDIEVGADYIKFTTTGYGHGVGMSQYGANALAEAGYTYDKILAQYYTGAELRSCSELFPR